MSIKDSSLDHLLQKLESSARKIVETRGYTREARKIKVLEELLKEQVLSENSNNSTRPTR
ncbi:MAG: hypothetical protein KDD22_06615 [Bdellovibrionales bacterium]|nr:hypothetical protein [Bdellovibrionales bacterium]